MGGGGIKAGRAQADENGMPLFRRTPRPSGGTLIPTPFGSVENEVSGPTPPEIAPGVVEELNAAERLWTAQQRELLRHRSIARPGQPDDLAHRLLAVLQMAEDRQPAAPGKRLEELGRAIDRGEHGFFHASTAMQAAQGLQGARRRAARHRWRESPAR